MAPDAHPIDTDGDVSSIKLLGLAILGGLLTIGAYWILGS